MNACANCGAFAEAADSELHLHCLAFALFVPPAITWPADKASARAMWPGLLLRPSDQDNQLSDKERGVYLAGKRLPEPTPPLVDSSCMMA
ncbi:hypothetical protein VTN96DRAFT_737 [Rasamsonia emersonii]